MVASAGDDKSHPVWRLTPFVDAPGAYSTGSYFFEWEREWRKVGDFRFSTDDVAFLIIPEHLHAAAKGFFENARAEDLGPAYDCPFIDAHWKRKQLKAVLALSACRDRRHKRCIWHVSEKVLFAQRPRPIA